MNPNQNGCGRCEMASKFGIDATSRAADLLARRWPELVPDEFAAWNPESPQAWEYRHRIASEIIDLLARHGFTIRREDRP